MRDEGSTMGRLIYAAGTSLDGYVADESGNFEWAELDEEVLTHINDRERRNRTYLFGRKVYETMSVWETPEVMSHASPATLAYVPTWQAAEKIVYSTTLQTVSTANTRLERTFDVDAVRKLKAEATHDLGIGGATLAAQAFRAGLVDEFHLLVAPVVAGGGIPFWPDQVPMRLELVDERRFDHGLVYLQYRSTS